MFLALLVAIRLVQSTPVEKLTYANPGARISVILQDLSKLTGTELKADKTLQDNALVIRFKDVEPAEALKRLAEAADGKWKTTQTGKLLSFDANLPTARYQAWLQKDTERRANEIRKATAKLAADEDPTKRAIAQAIQAIGIDELATSDRHVRRVYATNPAPLELPMPPLPDASLAALAKFEQPQRRRNQAQAPATPAASRLLLDFRPGMMGLEVRRTVFDASGHYLGEDSEQLSQVSIMGMNTPSMGADDSMVDDGDRPDQTKNEQGADADPKLSPLAQEFEAVAGGERFGGGGAHAALSPKLKAALLDPLNHEPDAFIGERWVHWAESKNLNLAVSLPEFVPAVGVANPASMAPGDMMLKMLDLQPKDGWLVAKPLRLDFAEIFTGARSVTALFSDAAKLLPTLKDTSQPTLAQLEAAYRVATTRLGVNLEILDPGLAHAVTMNLSFLTWMAALSPEDRQRLEGGAEIPVSTLNPQALQLLTAVVYSPEHLFQIPAFDSGPEPIDMSGSGEILDAQSDIFETANQVIPAGATIKLTTKTQPAFRFANARADGPVFNGIEELAGEAATEGERPIQIGQAQILTFTARMCAKVYQRINGWFYTFGADAPKYTPSQLPADLKKRYAEAVAQ
jgi:hypothetical protein